MIKKICLLTPIVFTCLQLSAQDDASLLTFGIKVSPAVGWMNANHNDVTSDGAAVKMGVGAIINFRLSEMFYAVSGMNYSPMGGYVSDTQSLSATDSYTNYKINYAYIAVPLAIRYRSKPIRNFRYFIEGGFNVGACANANEVRKNTVGKEKIDIGNLTNTFRLGAQIGGGVQYAVGQRSFLFAQMTLNKAITTSANTLYTATGRYEERLKLFPELLEFSVGFIY
ncbi:MAG: PorT family protein [Prevotellaceae bacterium]|jgi:hypothetical protein|nr:PorT family protein [Prevotellaceae bacterium]